MGANNTISLGFFFLSECQNFRRRTIQCFTDLMYRKILCFGGLCHNFRFSVEFFLCHSAEKFRGGTL